MKSIKISNYENLNIWLKILLKTKPNEKYQNLKLRKPQNLAGNPFKNQAKRKVSNLKLLRKPKNLAGNLLVKFSLIL